METHAAASSKASKENKKTDAKGKAHGQGQEGTWHSLVIATLDLSWILAIAVLMYRFLA